MTTWMILTYIMMGKRSQKQRMTTICFYLYEVQEQANLFYQDREVRTMVAFWGLGVDWKEPKAGFLGAGNILNLDLSVDYTGVI